MKSFCALAWRFSPGSSSKSTSGLVFSFWIALNHTQKEKKQQNPLLLFPNGMDTIFFLSRTLISKKTSCSSFAFLPRIHENRPFVLSFYHSLPESVQIQWQAHCYSSKTSENSHPSLFSKYGAIPFKAFASAILAPFATMSSKRSLSRVKETCIHLAVRGIHMTMPILSHSIPHWKRRKSIFIPISI